MDQPHPEPSIDLATPPHSRMGTIVKPASDKIVACQHHADPGNVIEDQLTANTIVNSTRNPSEDLKVDKPDADDLHSAPRKTGQTAIIGFQTRVHFDMTAETGLPNKAAQNPPYPGNRRKALCERCKNLDLSEGMFIIRSKHIQQPIASTQQAKDQSPSIDLHKATFRNTRQVVGTLEEILKTWHDCPFCSLVIRSVALHGEDPDLAVAKRNRTTNCFVNYEIDGRSSVRKHFRPLTRRIHLSWSDEAFEDSYLVFVTSTRKSQISTDIKNSWPSGDAFLGRQIDTGTNNQTLIRSWLDTCTNDHAKCSRDKSNPEFEKMVKKSFFGVIDVQGLCLTKLPMTKPRHVSSSSNGESVVKLKSLKDYLGKFNQYYQEATDHAPYVALSYVWGGKQACLTTLANVLTLREEGSLGKLLDKLPRVIIDAMEVTRRLGLRYLWVDSLCIVQDSERIWELNAQHMDLIYQNAVLTICAADGHDAQSGLRAWHRSSEDTVQHIEYCAGSRLMVSRLTETTVKSSTWNKRAWTFQERLLSNRCLIFSDNRVFFQCHSSTMSEDVVAEPEGTGWSLDLIHSPFQMLRYLQSRPFWVYAQCLSLYSYRQLTERTDVLAAFNGVSNLLTKSMGVPFVFGLPGSHFDLALLWHPTGPIKRRIGSDNKDIHKSRRATFPSWSWCGWMGAAVQYQDSVLAQITDNVHDWLSRHTWIRWYIRDGQGDLRPLWGLEERPCPAETEPRWRGYATMDDLPRDSYLGRKPNLKHSHRDRKSSRHQGHGHRRSPGPPPLDQNAYDRQEYQGYDTRYQQVEPYSLPRQCAFVQRPYHYPPPLQPQGIYYDDPYGLNSNMREPTRCQSRRHGTLEIPLNASRRDTDIEVRVQERRPRCSSRRGSDIEVRVQERRPRCSSRNADVIGVRAFSSSASDESNDSSDESENTATGAEHRRSTNTSYDSSHGDSGGRPDGSVRAKGFEVDSYGRKLTTEAKGLPYDSFKLNVPQSPYRTKVLPYDPHSGTLDRQFPDYGILQFFTWTAHLRLMRTSNCPNAVETDTGNATGGLQRYSIADAAGDWCGSIILDTAWVENWEKVRGARIDQGRFEFLAISDAKQFTQEECELWTYYIPKEREHSEWDLYYVLLTERVDGVWNRVALGKVFKAGFDNAQQGKSWREIVLA